MVPEEMMCILMICRGTLFMYKMQITDWIVS